jgi:hypothetical protein
VEESRTRLWFFFSAAWVFNHQKAEPNASAPAHPERGMAAKQNQQTIWNIEDIGAVRGGFFTSAMMEKGIRLRSADSKTRRFFVLAVV